MTEDEINQRLDGLLGLDESRNWKRDPKTFTGEDWLFLNENYGMLNKEEQAHVKKSYESLTPEEKKALTVKKVEKAEPAPAPDSAPAPKEESVKKEAQSEPSPGDLDELSFEMNLHMHAEKLENNKKNMKTVRLLAGAGIVSLIYGGSPIGAIFGLGYGLKKEWDHRDEGIGSGRSKKGIALDLLQYAAAGLCVPLLVTAAMGAIGAEIIVGAVVLGTLNAVTGNFLENKRVAKEIDREVATYQRGRQRTQQKPSSSRGKVSEQILSMRAKGSDKPEAGRDGAGATPPAKERRESQQGKKDRRYTELR